MLTVALVVAGGYGQAKEKTVEPDAVLFIAPLNDAIRLEAGTLEVRFSLDYSFDNFLSSDRSSNSPFPFLQIYDSKGMVYGNRETDHTFNLVMHQRGSTHGIVFANRFYYIERGDASVAQNHVGGIAVYGDKAKGPWCMAGEWHSVALTWEVVNETWKVELFIDGKFQRQQLLPKRSDTVRAFSKGDYLGIGSESLSPATILSYRLSNRVRTREEIASEQPLKADESTTFFLNGEIAGKIKTLKSGGFRVILKDAKTSVKQPMFVGEKKIVDTPKGKAIQFYKKSLRARQGL